MCFVIRPATIDDSEILWQLIRELAICEKLEHALTGTLGELQQALFCHQPKVFALLAELEHQPIGFSIYFYNFSMFLSRHGIYLESLYVRPEFQGQGYGKKLVAETCKIAVQNNCGRLEWLCLDWNQDAMSFYHKIDAEPRGDLIVYRLKQEALQKIASF